MNNKQLEIYRSELLSEKQLKIDAVNSQYDRKLSALNVLLEQDQPELQIPKPATMLNGHAATNLMQATIEAIQGASLLIGTSGQFSSETLLSYIKVKYPSFAKKPSDLSGALWRLKKDEKIEVVTQGGGRSPSIYRKTPKFDAVE